MKRKEYKLKADARKAIKNVSKQVGDMLGSTLGPSGRNYFLPIGITNDGKTIIEHFRFQDECEDNISLAFHEIARQQDKDGGDGTTTAMVLGAELVLSLIDRVGSIDPLIPGGLSSAELGRMLEAEKEQVLELLKGKVVEVKDYETLERIAFTAIESKEDATIVAEACWEAGKESMPVLNEGINEKIEKSVLKGVEYPFLIAHQSMFNKQKRAEYDNAAVLVVNHAFEEYAELTPFMQTLLATKPKISALVIVAKHFSVPFVASVAEVNRHLPLFKIVLVANNQIHQDTYEDLAAYVDAQAFDTQPKTGFKIEEVRFDHAGYVKKILVTEKDSKFIGGRGEERVVLNKQGGITRVGERVEQLKSLIELEKDEKERTNLEKRVAALLGGIVTLYVDAKTETEKFYKKLKVEDAMNSCRAALNGGMVKGAGVTLKEIAEELGSESLMYRALRKPYDRIIQNNLGEPVETEGIYDAYLVAKAGIENAVSVVKVLLTIEGIIADTPPSLVEELREKLFQE